MLQIAVILSLIAAVLSLAIDVDVNLQPVWGFEFCSHLSGSAFDMNSLVNYQTLAPYLTSANDRDLSKLASMKKPYLLSETFTFFPEAVDIISMAIAKSVQEHKIIHWEAFSGGRLHLTDFADPNAARRFACLSVAEGTHAFAPLASDERHQKILRFVESEKYFGGQMTFAPLDRSVAKAELALDNDVTKSIVALPEQDHVIESETSADGKLAFILMVHKDVDNVVEILQDVAAAKSTVLVHVDGNSLDMKYDLTQWLESEYENGNFDRKRVRIMEKSFKGAWAHSSLVFMQVEAMFQLLRMNGNWEYVINMSGNDVLLVDHSQIYSQLSSYGDANWIEKLHSFIPLGWENMGEISDSYKAENNDAKGYTNIVSKYGYANQQHGSYDTSYEENAKGYNQQHGSYDTSYEENAKGYNNNVSKYGYASQQQGLYDASDKEKNAVGRPHRSAFIASSGTIAGPLFKEQKFDRKAPVCYMQSSQWMILHRSAPEIMRKSPSAAMFLAFSEFEVCPDETFIARLLNFIPMYDQALGTAHTFRIADDNKRFLEWGYIHPRLLNINDKKLLANAVAKGKFIARKVDIQYEGELMEWIRFCRANNWSVEMCTAEKIFSAHQ